MIFIALSFTLLVTLGLMAQSRVAHLERRKAEAELARRRAYEKALALPFWDEEELERELWNRAARGDQLSEDIIQEMFWDDLQQESGRSFRS